MPNLSFCYLSKSIWKDKNSVKKLKELWRKITHTPTKEYFTSGEALCLLCSAHLYPVLGHIMSHTSQKTSDTRMQRWALAGALPALLYFPAHEHPKGALRCSLILRHLSRRTTSSSHPERLVSAPCTVPSHTAEFYNSRAPSPACSCFSCICPCCWPCAFAWEGRAAFCPCWILSLSCPQSGGKSTSCFFLSTA